MKKPEFITHRCPELLEQRASIRWYKKDHDKLYQWPEPDMWWLSSLEIDYDYDTEYLRDYARINYCPFCGKKLEVPCL